MLIILFFAMILLSITGSSPEPGGWVHDTGVEPRGNTTYTFSAHLRGDVGGEAVKLFLESDGSFLTIGETIELEIDWKRYAISYTTATTPPIGTLSIGASTTGEAVTTFYSSGLMLQTGALSAWEPGLERNAAPNASSNSRNLLDYEASTLEGVDDALELFDAANDDEALYIDEEKEWRERPPLKCVAPTSSLFEEVIWLGALIPALFVVGVALAALYYLLRHHALVLELDGGEGELKLTADPRMLRTIKMLCEAHGDLPPADEIDKKIDAAMEESDRGMGSETINVCPQCGGAELYYEGGFLTGYKYTCKDCSYVGPFIVERDLEDYEAIEEAVGTRDKSAFPEYIRRWPRGTDTAPPEKDREGIAFIPCPHCTAPVEVPSEPAQYPLRTYCERCNETLVLKRAPIAMLDAEEFGGRPTRTLVYEIGCPRCNAPIRFSSDDFPQQLQCPSCGVRTLLSKMPTSAEVVER